MDPEEVFGQIFGGERFEDIFGKISLAKDMKTALQEAEEAEDDSTKIQNGKSTNEDERMRKEEKDKKKAAEVKLSTVLNLITLSEICATYRTGIQTRFQSDAKTFRLHGECHRSG